jgi:hypothetical protein
MPCHPAEYGAHASLAMVSPATAPFGLDAVEVASTQAKHNGLRSWTEKFDERVWAVESAKRYLLAQQLVAAGERV